MLTTEMISTCSSSHPQGFGWEGRAVWDRGWNPVDESWLSERFS